MHVHLLCIYYIFTVYLVYKLTTFFSCMFFLLFLRHVIYHQHSYNWHGWYISWIHWCGMVGNFSSSVVRNFLHVVHILFFVVHILLYIPQILFNIIYFVIIAHYITCTFAYEFSINFLFVAAYCNSLLGCSSAEEFMNTFADVLMNEVETMRSQFAHSMYIVWSVYLHTSLSINQHYEKI